MALKVKFQSIALSVCTCLLAGPAAAQVWTPQGPSPIRYEGNTQAAPNNEAVGAFQAVAAHPTNPDILFAGAVNGGIWKTSNATATCFGVPCPNWELTTTAGGGLDLGPAYSITDIQYDPSDATHQTLWASIGRSSSYGFESSPWEGLLYTTNGGFFWNWVTGQGGAISLFDRSIVSVVPKGSTIVAAVERTRDNADYCTGSGIFRSVNTGFSFTRISGATGSGLPNGAVDALVTGPSPMDIFMLASVSGTWYCSGGTSDSDGIYISYDEGATWSKTGTPAMDALFPNDFASALSTNVKISLANGIIFVGIAPGNTGRLGGVFYFRSLDSDWTQMDLPLTTDMREISAGGPMEPQGIHPGGQAWVHFSMLADPNDTNIVYLGGDRQPCASEDINLRPIGDCFPNAIGSYRYTGRLFRGDASQASGSQWTPLTHAAYTSNNSAPHPDQRDLDMDANGNLIASNDGGVYHRQTPRTNSGDWRSLNGDIQASEFYSIAYDPVSRILIGGTQDNGTPAQTLVADTYWNQQVGGDGGDVTIDSRATVTIPVPCPGNPSTIQPYTIRYDSAQFLGGFRRSLFDQNNIPRCSKSLTHLLGDNGGPVESQFFTPVSSNRVQGRYLVIGGANGVFESLDAGDTATKIPVSPAGVEPQVRPGNTISYGVTGNSRAVYVAAGFFGLFRRLDAASPLQRMDSLPGSYKGAVVTDPANASLVFAVSDGVVYRSLNAGATWGPVPLSSGPRGVPYVTSIAYLDRTSGLDAIAAGTRSDGVFIAELSNIYVWNVSGINLPRAAIKTLQYSSADDVLVAGTLGRGAWTMGTTDLSIVKTLVTPGPYTVGQSIEYEIVVENRGPHAATNVTIIDVPASMTIDSVSSLQDECDALPCERDRMNRGEKITLSVMATINVAGPFDNYAEVRADQPDRNYANNSDSTGNGGLSTYGTVVLNNADDGFGSLRRILAEAPPGSVITFDPSLDNAIIGLSEKIILTKSAEINGSSLFNAVTISGENTSQIFEISTGQTVKLDTLMLSNGNGEYGGAIIVWGALTVANSTLMDNHASIVGGAIYNSQIGDLTLVNSTVSGNTAPYNGGGIINYLGTVTAINSTFSNNTSNAFGGGIDNDGGIINLENSIIAGNFCTGCAAPAPPDIGNRNAGTINALGNNLVGDNTTVTAEFPEDGILVGGNTVSPVDPRLKDLDYYGGPTYTQEPWGDSAAVDAAAITANNPPKDQRGLDRPLGPASDLGSIEVQYADLYVSKTLDTPGPYAPGQSLTFSIVLTNKGPMTATSVRLDEFPQNLTVTNISDSQFACSAGKMGCDFFGLSSGQSVPITVTATVDAPGPFQNDVSVYAYEADPDFSNNNASANGTAILPAGIVSISNVTVAEENGTATFVATLDRAVAGGFDLTVTTSDGTAKAGMDYTALSDTIRFAGTEGETQNIEVVILNDNLPESQESFTLTLGGAPADVVLSPASGTGTITDTDIPQFMVTNDSDTSDGVCDQNCSLREAIGAVNADGSGEFSITFDPTVFKVPRVINLTRALPEITASVNIVGPGARLLTVRRNNGNYRIFSIVYNNLLIQMNGFTISNGYEQVSYGGGILSFSELRLRDMHLTGNNAANGGGVYLTASGLFENSTFSGNTSSEGGGIAFQGRPGSVLQLNSSTVSGNAAANGGGIFVLNLNQVGTIELNLFDSTIAHNAAQGNGKGIRLVSYGEDKIINLSLANSIVAGHPEANLNTSGGKINLQSQGYNLADDNFGGILIQSGDQANTDPLLAPLADNGGPTPTHSFPLTSPVLDSGSCAISGATHDQRGIARGYDAPLKANANDACDIGAVEWADFNGDGAEDGLIIFIDGFDVKPE